MQELLWCKSSITCHHHHHHPEREPGNLPIYLLLCLKENTTSPIMSCFGGGDEKIKEQTRKNKAINDQLKKDKDVYKSTHRLLLLGEWQAFFFFFACKYPGLLVYIPSVGVSFLTLECNYCFVCLFSNWEVAGS